MIIALDTSTPTCRLSVRKGDAWHDYVWEAGRELASNLLGYLETTIGPLQSITGMIALQGPGSFTGLRIGLTVLNTIANTQQIPIVGTMSDTWREDGLARLKLSENDRLVMPVYGSEPNITTARK